MTKGHVFKNVIINVTDAMSRRIYKIENIPLQVVLSLSR